MALQDYNLTLAPGVPQTINRAGNFFCIYDATAAVGMSIDGGVTIYRNRGETQIGEFKEITFSSLVLQTVTIICGFGSMTVPGVVETVNIGTVTITASNQALGIADVNAAAAGTTVLVGAKAGRKTVYVKIASSEPLQELRIGGPGSTDSTHGVPIGPGEGVTIETEGALSIYNPGPAAVNVSVLECNRV